MTKYLYTNHRVLYIRALKKTPPRIDPDGGQEYKVVALRGVLNSFFTSLLSQRIRKVVIVQPLSVFRLAGEVKNKSALITNTCTVSKALTFTITNSSIPVHALVLGTCRCLFKHCSSVCYNVTRQSCIHFEYLEIFFSSHRCGLGVSWTRQDWHRELCGCT